MKEYLAGGQNVKKLMVKTRCLVCVNLLFHLKVLNTGFIEVSTDRSVAAELIERGGSDLCM